MKFNNRRTEDNDSKVRYKQFNIVRTSHLLYFGQCIFWRFSNGSAQSRAAFHSCATITFAIRPCTAEFHSGTFDLDSGKP